MREVKSRECLKCFFIDMRYLFQGKSHFKVIMRGCLLKLSGGGMLTPYFVQFLVLHRQHFSNIGYIYLYLMGLSL